MPYQNEVLLRGKCITIQLANAKLEAFRGWYAGLPAVEQGYIDRVRSALKKVPVWQLGPNGVDEIIASLLLVEMEVGDGE